MRRILYFTFALVAALAGHAQPMVDILYPTDGSTVTTPLSLRVGWGGFTNVLESVEYFANGQSIGIVSNWPIAYPATSIPEPQLEISRVPAPPASSSIVFYSPFTLYWDPSPGDYALIALATDAQGVMATSAPVNVSVVPMPVVTVVATQPIASPGSPGDFTISRTGYTNSDLTVQFDLGTYAANGIYHASVSNIVIPAGAVSADVLINAKAPLANQTETVILTIANFPVPLYSKSKTAASPSLVELYPPYMPGSPNSATVYIEAKARGRHGPSVKLSQPRPGQRFPSGANIGITANTIDANGYVTAVDFFDGVKLIGESLNTTSISPGVPVAFNFTWTNAPAGSHALRARAMDNLGAIQFSTSVRVFVGSAGRLR
ncbi:MAG TPA: Ig-like domain-containing protein [Candidatus Angelobacter sp.]|nr:Ig-like domain-containing protein [Candidatus Angelobacter sp.]